MLPVVENVAIGMPLLVNADAQRRFVVVGTISRVGFQGGEWLQHFASMKHEAWVHAPPPQRSVFGSIEWFV